VADLLNAGLIPSFFDNKTCLDVSKELVEYKNNTA